MKTVCKRCLYDNETIPNITFDENGICNYCHIHDQLNMQYPVGEEGKQRFLKTVEEIKKAGRKKKYDVIVGVSGGCDSSYLVYLARQYGLRPLAVHFDNTWNSTIATENINNVLKKLDVDLYTYVVDNKEYDDIYRSFMKAGVPDIEAPTDIGLAVVLNKAAAKFNVRYTFEGHNFRTEGIAPLDLLYMDGKYIESVQKQFGTYQLKTFPNMPLHLFLKWMLLNRIKRIRPYWSLDYNKAEAMKFLTREFGWKWYGGHHLENRFTAFYHSYFIPRRFGKDYRLLELSALIRSGQITRDEGLGRYQQPPYMEPGLLDLVKKRLGFTDAEFEHLMTMPRKTYRDYKTYKRTFERMRPFFYVMTKLNLVPYSFYMKYTIKHDTRPFEDIPASTKVSEGIPSDKTPSKALKPDYVANVPVESSSANEP